MKEYYYKVSWYPFSSRLFAKNKESAWKKLQQLYPDYEVKKCITLF